MNKMLQYSLPNLIKAYNENKDLIIAYQSGKPIEGYTFNIDADGNTKDVKISGLAIGVFVTVLVISIIFWIWGLILMIVYWDKLAGWAKAIGIIGLIIGFPLATIIVGYIGHEKK